MTRIRPRLLLIATVAIVPLALMAAIALEALLAQQRHQAEDSALNLTRALATAIDNELRLTVSALQSLALTEPFGAVSARRPRGSARARDQGARGTARVAGGAARAALGRSRAQHRCCRPARSRRAWPS